MESQACCKYAAYDTVPWLDKPRRPFPKPKPLLEAHLGVVEVQSVWVGYMSFRQGAYWLLVETKYKARRNFDVTIKSPAVHLPTSLEHQTTSIGL